MKTGNTVNAGGTASRSHATASANGKAASAQQSTPVGEPEWSKEEDEVCWKLIHQMGQPSWRGEWPTLATWQAYYEAYKVPMPPRGRSESDFEQRCDILRERRDAQRLTQAQSSGHSAAIQLHQDKTPAQQPQSAGSSAPQTQSHSSSLGTAVAKGRNQGSGVNNEQSHKEAGEAANSGRGELVRPSKPKRVRKSISKKMKDARRGRKQASMLLKGSFESFKVKKVGRRSKIITFRGKGTIRVPL